LNVGVDVPWLVRTARAQIRQEENDQEAKKPGVMMLFKYGFQEIVHDLTSKT
jgi:hypothetical protein